jgi:uncharacterized protein (DUF1697 family)
VHIVTLSPFAALRVNSAKGNMLQMVPFTSFRVTNDKPVQDMGKPMQTYVVLMRGINVGGKNKISMAELRTCLTAHGFKNVITYIQSGNVVLQSNLGAKAVGARIEKILERHFTVDGSIIRILALEHETFKEVVAQAPKEFGKDNAKYRYYVLFLIQRTPGEAIKEIDVRAQIDMAWPGKTAIYYRLPSLTSPDAAKSYLNKVAQKPIYQFITMRNWNTTTKLLKVLEENK